MSPTPAPLSSLRVSKHFIPAHAGFPNTSLHPHRPLMIYHDCLSSFSASNIESHLTKVGVVEPQWRYPMYRQHHYHSTTNEILAVHRGSATLCFGGGENPEKVVTDVKHGDVMILPAGVAHAMLEDHGGFQMVGGYPVGSNRWDHCVGKEGQEAEERIRAVGWFDRDPVYGDDGPVLTVREK